MNINVTLVIQIVAFLLLIYFVRKVLWDPLTSVINERRTKINEGLSAAEKSKEELDSAEMHAKTIKSEARDEAKNILSKAENRANDLIEEAKTLAGDEAIKIRKAAEKNIQSERDKATTELTQEISKLVVIGAEKIIQKEVDPKLHAKMIDGLIKSI